MATLEQLVMRAAPDLPVGALRDAWRKLGPTASLGDLMMTAGHLRDRHHAQPAGQRTAPPQGRLVSSPSARQHGRVLGVVLEPTVRYVRRKVFGEEAVPFLSEKAAFARLESEPDLGERLRPMVERIVIATCFSETEVWKWVLVGRAPRLPITVTLCPRLSRLPDGRWIDSTQVRIESAVPLTGDAEIREATRVARALWGTERMKAWRDADVRLVEAVQRTGGPPKGAGMLRRWGEIAEEAGLPSGPAAIQRWNRVKEKAREFGLHLDPRERALPHTSKRWAIKMAEQAARKKAR
jgi:hypothetical protein